MRFASHCIAHFNFSSGWTSKGPAELREGQGRHCATPARPSLPSPHLISRRNPPSWGRHGYNLYTSQYCLHQFFTPRCQAPPPGEGCRLRAGALKGQGGAGMAASEEGRWRQRRRKGITLSYYDSTFSTVDPRRPCAYASRAYECVIPLNGVEVLCCVRCGLSPAPGQPAEGPDPGPPREAGWGGAARVPRQPRQPRHHQVTLFRL